MAKIAQRICLLLNKLTKKVVVRLHYGIILNTDKNKLLREDEIRSRFY